MPVIELQGSSDAVRCFEADLAKIASTSMSELPAPLPERFPEENPGKVLYEAPPRKLDWATQAALFFGDMISQTGWGLFALGSIFFWTTSVNSDLVSRFEEHNIDWHRKAGVILQADSTGVFQGKNAVWQYRHSFAIDGEI